METITYIVANYNNARYVEDCLRSLKNQTCDRWHCLVCDDHSTDRSVEVKKKHLSSRIRLLENSQNVGYIKTLKRLIAAAPTDIVGILDSDDALKEDATLSVLQTYADDGNVGFTFSSFLYMDENLQRERAVQSPPGEKPGEYSALWFHVSHLKTFRRSVYYKTSGLDENLLYAEDRDLVYKLEEISPPVYIDKILYKYRKTALSQSRAPDKQRIGVRNHIRAKKHALRRRKIKGLHYLLLLCMGIAKEFFEMFPPSSEKYYPRLGRCIGGYIYALFRLLNKRLNARHRGF